MAIIELFKIKEKLAALEGEIRKVPQEDLMKIMKGILKLLLSQFLARCSREDNERAPNKLEITQTVEENPGQTKGKKDK